MSGPYMFVVFSSSKYWIWLKTLQLGAALPISVSWASLSQDLLAHSASFTLAGELLRE